MTSFVITAVFEVAPGRVPVGTDVVARWWGSGHEMSHCDGRTLTLVVDVVARSADSALESVLAQAAAVWEGLTGQSLPEPSALHLHRVQPQEQKVVASRVGCGPDRLFAEAAACRVAHLRAAVAALSEL